MTLFPLNPLVKNKIMTIAETYSEWRSLLKSPDESLFYYHKDLERILLGLAIFAIASRPLFQKLGKAEALKILPIYIVGLISAWIDEDEESFETMFKATMPVAEAYVIAGQAFSKSYPSKAKIIRSIQNLYGVSASIGGDMTDELAEELLDDLSTDGNQLYSDKISDLGTKLIFLTRQYGFDIPAPALHAVLDL